MDAGLIYGCLAPHPPILVPALAGHRVEQVRQTRDAMQQVASEIFRLSPDTVVLVSPHAPVNPYAMGVSLADRYVGGFDAFGVTSVRITARGDATLASAIEAECHALDVPHCRFGRAAGIHDLDHGASVPLFFMRDAGVDSDLVLLSFSTLDVDSHRRFGQAVASAARSLRKRVALVASGDLSHRLIQGSPAGFSPRGREFDDAIVSALRRQDRDSILKLDEKLLHEAGECGYRSLVIALGALPDADVNVLSYQGPFGVGYLVARFQVAPILHDRSHSDSNAAAAVPGRSPDELEVLRLARHAVESYVREGKPSSPPTDPQGLLAERAGVFVSLKIEGQLRGCIGTFLPTEATVAAEIIRNAVSAASRDPRFLPVGRDELERLEYSVDVLTTPEAVMDPSGLDPKRYGVIVQAGARRGLLLPDLEAVSTVEDQLEIARRKAGIPRNAPMQLYRFEVRRISEKRLRADTPA